MEKKWTFPLSVPKKGWKKWLRIAFGHSTLLIRPKLKNSFFEGHHPNSKLERAALATLVIKLKNKGKNKKLAELHRNLWASNDAYQFYTSTEERFDLWFSKMKKDLESIVGSLQKEAAFENFVEIGCGNGKILKCFSENYPGFKSFIGVDINSSQIECNKDQYHDDKKLKFYASDANQWLEDHPTANTIYFTFGGVLEYFTEKELRMLLKNMVQKPKSGLIIYEPIANDFDPKTENKSKLYGNELSFSHPYSFLVDKIGMKIIYENTSNNKVNNGWILLGAIK